MLSPRTFFTQNIFRPSQPRRLTPADGSQATYPNLKKTYPDLGQKCVGENDSYDLCRFRIKKDFVKKRL